MRSFPSEGDVRSVFGDHFCLQILRNTVLQSVQTTHGLHSPGGMKSLGVADAKEVENLASHSVPRLRMRLFPLPK